MADVKLRPENTMIDIPDLNQFKIGDHVVVDASHENDRFEGVVIGIELRRVFSTDVLQPSITLLHDGYITDEFRPQECRKIEAADRGGRS